MIKRNNYYSSVMSADYEKLRKLLDDGYVVVCFVNYKFDCGGGRKIMYRDVAKVKSKDYPPASRNYGYVVEARGIVYLDWDRNRGDLRHDTFEELCDELNLQYIDYA